MRFLTMVKGYEGAGTPPRELMDAVGRIAEEASRNGRLLQTGGLYPMAAGARVRLSGGNVTVVDGPFSEAKEVVGGWAMFEVASKQEIVEATVRFMELHRDLWPGWEGEAEVRQMADAPPSSRDR